MVKTLLSIPSLLLGIGIFLVGNGFLGTLLGVRAQQAGIGSAVIGVMMSAYFVGYVAGTFRCPALIRRFGHVRVYAALAGGSAATALAYGLFVDVVAWSMLRMLSGFCMVGLFAVMESWLQSQSTNEQRGSVFATYMTTVLLALGLGQLLMLVPADDPLRAYALVAGCMCLGLVPVALTQVEQPSAVMVPRVALGRLYEASPLGFTGVAAAGLTSGAFWGVGALYALAAGRSEHDVGLFMGAVVFGGMALQWPIGWLSDRMDRRAVLTGASLVGAVAAAGLLLVDGPPLLQLCVAFVFGGVMFALYGLSVAQINDRLHEGEIVEAASGVLLVFGIGAALGPAVAGSLLELGAAAFPALFTTVMLALAAFGRLRMRRRAPVPMQGQGEYVALLRTSPIALEVYPQAAEPAVSEGAEAPKRGDDEKTRAG